MELAIQSVAENSGKRRYRTMEERRCIGEETLAEGVSVAVVARRHGVNANQVFQWRKLYQSGLLGPVCVQCRVLGVNATGYHQHRLRRSRISRRRHMTNEALLAHIRAVHAETRGAYGWPRI
jgi:transposase-like protein